METTWDTTSYGTNWQRWDSIGQKWQYQEIKNPQKTTFKKMTIREILEQRFNKLNK